MLNGRPSAAVSCAAAGGGATVVPLPVLPWIWDCAAMLLASLVVAAADFAALLDGPDTASCATLDAAADGTFAAALLADT
jgi:hypothetical protein